jgi:hypothetical protein
MRKLAILCSLQSPSLNGSANFVISPSLKEPMSDDMRFLFLGQTQRVHFFTGQSAFTENARLSNCVAVHIPLKRL